MFVALSAVVTAALVLIGTSAEVDLTDVATPVLLTVVGAAAGATPGHEGHMTGA